MICLFHICKLTCKNTLFLTYVFLTTSEVAIFVCVSVPMCVHHIFSSKLKQHLGLIFDLTCFFVQMYQTSSQIIDTLRTIPNYRFCKLIVDYLEVIQDLKILVLRLVGVCCRAGWRGRPVEEGSPWTLQVCGIKQIWKSPARGLAHGCCSKTVVPLSLL